MQQRQKQRHQSTRIFTASEVAEFEYCPLVWWYEQFEPMARADTEELFARLVELEHEHDAQAPALPEYRMVEQLLLRRGAFDTGQQQHREHAEEVEQAEEERVSAARSSGGLRGLTLITIVILVVALLLIAAWFVLTVR
jgi:hypothetical protein